MDTTLELKPQPTQSRFKFWLKWFGWNALGYLVLGLVNFLLNLASTNGLFSSEQISMAVRQIIILIALLLPAAAIGWTQQRALRNYIHNHFLWFLATVLSYAMISLMSGGTYYASINNRLSSTGVSGYEARPVELAILAMLSIVGSGILLGLFQWLVLRLEVRRAGWWIAWSSGAYAAFGIIGGLVFQQISNYLQANPTALTQESIPYVSAVLNYVLYLIFPAISGIGMAFLLLPRKAPAAEPAEAPANQTAGSNARLAPSGGEDNYRKRLLIRLTLATALAILLNGLLDVLGIVTYISGLIAPLIKDPQISGSLPAVLLAILLGLMVGLAQIWALGPGYPRRWIWVVAAVIGFFFQGLNSLIPVDVLNNWAQQGLTQYPTLWLEFIRQIAFVVGFWLALGLIQTAALWQWAGKRSWAWILVIPVMEAFMLLARLVFGYPLESGALALVFGAALIFFLRSGWTEDLILAPKTDTPPAAADLDLAADILQNRLNQALNIHCQVTVEDGLLIASFNSKRDAEFAVELALQQGKLAIFVAPKGLKDGAALPQDAEILLTETDVDSASKVDMPSGGPSVVRLKLTEEGDAKLTNYLEAHPDIFLGAALDGVVLTTFPSEAPTADGLDMIGVPSEDSWSLMGILDNEPLPFSLEVVEEEEEQIEPAEAAA
jgi:hypothetical protein